MVGEPDSRVGILALQGDFPAHGAALAARGLEVRLVRRPADLEGLTAIVLPGGESTVMMKLARSAQLVEPLRALVTSGIPVLATCAGLILLARDVSRPEQESLDVLDLAVERNGYGRQVRSGVHRLRGSSGFPDCDGVFIRAPRITRVGQDIETLARLGEDVVLVQRGPILAACFHPELAHEHPLIDRFQSLIASHTFPLSTPPTPDPATKIRKS